MSTTKRPADIRDQITAYLSTVEDATAAQITKHTTEKDYPSRVLRALNEMRTDALIECEQKGKSRELSYWLAVPAATTAPVTPAPNRSTDRAEQRRQIIRAAIAGKTPSNGPAVKDLAAACGVTGQYVEQLLVPMLRAGTVGKVRNDGERFHRVFDPSTQATTQPQPEAGHNTGSDGAAVKESLTAAASWTATASAESIGPEKSAAEDVKAGDSEGGETDISETKPRIESGDDFETRAVKLAVRNHNEREELARKYAAKDNELLEQARLVVSLRDELATTEQKRLATTAELTKAMKQLDAIREHLAPFPVGIDPSSMTEVELAQSAAAAIRDGLDRIFAKSSDGGVSAELANAHALSTKLQTLLDSKTHECEALRAELANTRTEGEQAVDVLDAAHGYLVKAPKRKPRFLTQPEAALNAAMACARNGSGRGDVYALVHVGTAKRGAEWTEPN